MDRIHLQHLYLWDLTIFFIFLNSFKGSENNILLIQEWSNIGAVFLMKCLGWRVVLLVPRGPVLAFVSPILLFLKKGVTSQEATVSPLLPPFCFSLGGVWLTSGAALVASCSGSADADLHLVCLRFGSQGLVF